jgi:hypothetical protein
VFTRADFVRLRKPLSPRGGGGLPASAAPKVKCVVWDLDNIVWRGTLVEDGPEALQVRPEIVEIIRASMRAASFSRWQARTTQAKHRRCSNVSVWPSSCCTHR